MKKVLVAMALVIIAGGAYLGYAKHQRSQVTASLVPHVKNTSLRVENAMRLEFDSDSNMTFQEVFAKLESDLSEIDKRLLEVQTISSADNADLTTPAVDYLRASQAYLRATLLKYRKRLANNSASNWVDTQISEMKAAVGGYGFDMHKRSAEKALQDLEKASAEYAATFQDLNKAVIKLQVARDAVTNIFREDALVQEDLMKKMVERSAEASSPAKPASHAN